MRSTRLIVPLLTATLLAHTALAQSGPRRPAAARSELASNPNQVIGNEITEAQRRAVESGLAYLASKQRPNGAYTSNYGGGGHIGITSLAGIAFMSAGNLPGRGKYGQQVAKCLDYVLANCQQSGFISSDNSHGSMYGHGFATLFLGEVYGMTGNEEVKEKLQKAVKLLEKTQNTEGGWRYQPVPYDADISVTIAEVMGLRSARDAGIKVDKKTIDEAVKYVRRCQNPDGGFSYMARMGGGSGSAFARSAAGVAALYYAGIFEGNDLTKGLKYLGAFTPGGHGQMEGHFFYGHYYCSQAMFLAGGEYWAKYYPSIRDVLIARQNKATGGWAGDQGGDDYGTAMALIILQMPNRYLPVFHGKGPGN